MPKTLQTEHNVIMTQWDVSAVCDLMIEAGKIALDHFTSPGTEHKADTSLVTVADRAIEAYLAEALAPDADEALLIGEETSGAMTQNDVDAALAGATWVVDPIDGTAPYANRLPTWGVSVGFMSEGRLTDGALFLPRTGELFITSGDDVLYHRGPRDPDYWDFSRLSPLAATDRAYRSTGMVSLPQEIMYTGGFSGRNPFQSVGSAVYSVAKLIQGSYICYVARVRLWDLAGSLPILHRLGFHLQFADGTELTDRVTTDGWVLDASSSRMWKSTGLLYIAADTATIEYVKTHHNGKR